MLKNCTLATNLKINILGITAYFVKLINYSWKSKKKYAYVILMNEFEKNVNRITRNFAFL